MAAMIPSLRKKGAQNACLACQAAVKANSSLTGAQRWFASTSRQNSPEDNVTTQQAQDRAYASQRLIEQSAKWDDVQGTATRDSTTRAGLTELQKMFTEVNQRGPQRGSIIQRQEEKAEVKRRHLPKGLSMSPGDLRKERMWPDAVPRQNTAMDAMGPNARKAKQTDFFLNSPSQDGKGINPLNEYLNPELLSRFVTNMGKIMSRNQTQLTWKNQRRLGKAIRRARAMGLMPYFGDISEAQIKNAKAFKFGMIETGRGFGSGR